MSKYEDFLKEQDKKQRERYLNEFEELKNGEFFRKIKIELSSDYEFVKDEKNYERVYFSGMDSYINVRSLYFKKIDNNTVEEAITRERFIRTKDNIFYNENTCLKFDFFKGFEKAVCMDIDFVYAFNANNYFEYYKDLALEDEKLRDKGQCLLLKKGINFTK